MMKVTPMMTGIICNKRRITYLPTRLLRSVLKCYGRNIASARRVVPAGRLLTFVPFSRRSLCLDRDEIELLERVHLDVGHLVGEGDRGLGIPQRSDRHVRGERGLGLLVQRVRFVGRLRRRR